MASKKSHRTKVRVRSRQVLQPQNRSVQWPTEPSRELVPTLAQDDDDNDNEQPAGLPLGFVIKMNEPDDQECLHPIYDIECSQDQDGCLDNDSWDNDDPSMSDWEEE